MRTLILYGIHGKHVPRTLYLLLILFFLLLILKINGTSFHYDFLLNISLVTLLFFYRG